MAMLPEETIAPPMEVGLRALEAARSGTNPSGTVRRRGRPMDMVPEDVLEHIRDLARHRNGLFRVHRERPALYARARRQFGSWEGAVRAAGLDYAGTVTHARQRALNGRRRARGRPRRTR